MQAAAADRDGQTLPPLPQPYEPSAAQRSRPEAARPRMGLSTFVPSPEMARPERMLVDRVGTRLELPIAFDGAEAAEVFEAAITSSDDGAALFRPARSMRGRTREFDVAPGWHLSGCASLRLDRRTHRGMIVLDLSLNPSRFVATLPWTISADAIHAADPRDMLQRQASRPLSLDGNDNLLGAGGSLEKGGEPERHPQVRSFPALLAAYLAAIERLLALVLRPAVLADRMQLTEPRLTSATSAELYEEFHTPDAVSTVEGLRSAIVAAAPNAAWRTHIGGAMDRNSASISVPGGKTKSTTIYAKTTRRVRLEIRYSGDVREHALPRHQRGQPTTLAAILIALRHDAARNINQLLGGLSMHATRGAGQRVDLLDLATAIGRAAGDDHRRARDVLSLLANHGGITETEPEGVAPPSLVAALVSAGVVARAALRHGNAKDGGRRYALTAPYARAVAAALASIGQAPSPLSPTLGPSLAVSSR